MLEADAQSPALLTAVCSAVEPQQLGILALTQEVFSVRSMHCPWGGSIIMQTAVEAEWLTENPAKLKTLRHLYQIQNSI